MTLPTLVAAGRGILVLSQIHQKASLSLDPLLVCVVLFLLFAAISQAIWESCKPPAHLEIYSYSAYYMQDGIDGPGFYYTILDEGVQPVDGGGPFGSEEEASTVAKMECDSWNKHGRGIDYGN